MGWLSFLDTLSSLGLTLGWNRAVLGLAAGVLLGCVGVGVALFAWSSLASSLRRQRVRAKWARARAGEARALTLFATEGYEVQATQATHRWPVSCGGERQSALLRADYLVTRRGKRYVADVKTGRLAPEISTVATRRQLLEYMCAYSVEGVLLVDVERDRIMEVKFPGLARPSTKNRGAVVLAGVVGVAVGFFVQWAMLL